VITQVEELIIRTVILLAIMFYSTIAFLVAKALIRFIKSNNKKR